jgi:hypothetical protein
MRQKPARFDHTFKDEMVLKSDAMKHAKKVIDDTLNSMEHPRPRPAQKVSEMLDKLLLSTRSDSRFMPAESSLHDKIQEVLEPIKPCIYGRTPMRRSLEDAVTVFSTDKKEKNFLFILSDGLPTDGDPLPVAKKLHSLGVIIVTCFLTADNIRDPKCLLDSSRNLEGEGQRLLFEMSSTMKNTHTPISYLVDAEWTLPPSGESRLFIQANSLEVVNEFCAIVVSQLTKPCDALVHILHKVPLATYINQTNANFTPKKQEEKECYAHAIATVFHLAMHRIEGREGGYPTFREIRDRLVTEYGKQGAKTEKVLEEVCPEYRLHYRKVKEAGARKAINERRPVVATFSFKKGQQNDFVTYFRNKPKGILKKSDIATGEHSYDLC